jgi:transposase
LIPLTVPEVRRLLHLLTEPPERHGFLRHWSRWRRAHQAVARRGHGAARARARPVARSPALPAPSPPPEDWQLPAALTDAQWARVQSLLPPRAPVGRPPRDTRAVFAGVLWVLQTNASWRALPAEYGPWRTIYGRHRAWVATGLWPRLIAALNDTKTSATEVSL